MDLGCGITLVFLPMFCTGRCFKFIIIYTKKGKKIQCDDLEGGYNVELKRKLYNSFDKMVKRILYKKNCPSIYNVNL